MGIRAKPGKRSLMAAMTITTITDTTAVAIMIPTFTPLAPASRPRRGVAGPSLPGRVGGGVRHRPAARLDIVLGDGKLADVHLRHQRPPAFSSARF
jgi:hypothetical protein